MTITPPSTQAAFDDAESVRLRVREPADLVALVPYLLHFHPTESLVAVLFDAGRLMLTARFDLPPSTAPSAEVVAGFVEALDDLGERAGAAQLVLLGYSESQEWRPRLEELAAACRLDLLEALWVSGDRWWSVTCDRDCCPAEGRPYDIGSHLMAAEAVLAGLGLEAGRDSFAALAAGPPVEHAGRLAQKAAALRENLTGTRPTRQRRMRRAARAYLNRPEPPSELEALTLAVLAADVEVRDVALAEMTRASADAHVRLWAAVVRQVPEDLAAAPLCLLGVAGWLSGNGALLNCCVERVELIDPTYSMGHICRDIAERALPPRFWDSLMDGLAGR